MRQHWLIVISCVFSLLFVSIVNAHAPVEREAEFFQVETRLFIADNENDEIIVLDLPGGEIIARISVPPKVMSMGGTDSGAYVLATRGRDTDRSYVTVIDTGISPDEPAMRLPVVSKTLLLGKNISGPSRDNIRRLHDRYLLVSEAAGEIMLWEENDLASSAAFSPKTLQISPPDHYHFAEVENGRFLVGMTRAGEVRLFEADGRYVETFACNRAHGVIRVGSFTFFGCHEEILVFSGAKEHQRIKNPGTIRAAGFYHGNGRLFAGTEDADAIIWLDLETLEAGEFTFSERVERLQTAMDGHLLLILLANGELHIHDGFNGEHIDMLQLSGPIPYMQRTTVGANEPTIAVRGTQAYISLPHAGEVVSVRLAMSASSIEAEITGRWQTGGMPTRIVAVGRDD